MTTKAQEDGLPVRRILIAALLAAPSVAFAQLAIEITGAGAQRTPVAVAPFAGENTLPPTISSIIRGDLERSGLFRSLEVPALNPPLNESTAVNYAEWRGRLADALVVGSLVQLPNGRFETRVRVDDVVKQSRLGAVALPTAKDNVRAVGHRAADYVYEKLTGEKGVFSTLISYVVKRGSAYELQIADADGLNDQTILKSHEPIISPAWSPDGKRLAFERNVEIWTIGIDGKRPRRVVSPSSIIEGPPPECSAAPGARRIEAAETFGAPVWSPDGGWLLLGSSESWGDDQATHDVYIVRPDGSDFRTIAPDAAAGDPDWQPLPR